MTASGLVMMPSTGTISPARTRMASPTATRSTGTSSMADAARRWAMRGARSISDLRSRSARATAKSSSRLPPAYMIATTIPAKFWPRMSAPDIDRNATASTPMRPARRSRIMETNSPATTGNVPPAQHHAAKSPRPAAQAADPRTSPASAMTISARRNNRSLMIAGCGAWRALSIMFCSNSSDRSKLDVRAMPRFERQH